MNRIICIAKEFPVYDLNGYPTGKKKFLTDYAFNEDTGKAVVVQTVHPLELGAKFDNEIGEWVLEYEEKK